MQEDGFRRGRFPLADPAAEADRVSAYWAWLDGSGPELSDRAAAVLPASGGGRWVRLARPADADCEAFSMRHSIGHSWGKYSSFGDIFSLRSPDNVPLATILAAGGKVVHAREHENARLSPANMEALHAFASEMGLEVVADELPFDVLHDDSAPNTRFRYLRRTEEGKKFGTAVMQGRLGADVIRSIVDALQAGIYFHPAAVGLPDLGVPSGAADHEVLSIRFVRDEPTVGMAAEDFHEAWAAAAARGSAPASR